MKQFLMIGAAVLLFSACAAGRSSDCAYRSLIGQNVYSADLGAIRASGKEVRLLYPDSFIGFERKPNRVNVTRDMSDQIVDVTCG